MKYLWSALFLLVGCGGGGSSTSVTQTPYTPPTLIEDKDDMFILAVGQSLIANAGECTPEVANENVFRIDSNYDKVQAENPVRINNLADANGCNYLPYLGDHLLQDYNTVTYLNVAVGGTSVLQWSPLNYEGFFYKIVDAIDQGYEFTHVLYHQGSSDRWDYGGLSVQQYKDAFMLFLCGLRDLNITAPVYLARSTYAFGGYGPLIRQAQNELIAENSDVFEGVDSDQVLSRYDDAHFDEAGLRDIALRWYKLLFRF